MIVSHEVLYPWLPDQTKITVLQLFSAAHSITLYDYDNSANQDSQNMMARLQTNHREPRLTRFCPQPTGLNTSASSDTLIITKMFQNCS